MIYLNGLNSISPLGGNLTEELAILKANKSPYLRKIAGFLPENEEATLGELSFIDSSFSRNISLAKECLKPLSTIIKEVKKEVEPGRIGLLIGSSTSLISDVERRAKNSYSHERDQIAFDCDLYEIGSISSVLKELLAIKGPCYTIATACSSGARVLMSGARLIKSGLCDAVIVGAVDCLSYITVSGFYALGALSKEQTIPFHKDRHGINIAEGAGFCVLSTKKYEEKPLKLLGFGAMIDGFHISAPREDGLIAMKAINAALDMANLRTQDIGYVNLHGTGTKLNDAMEGNIIRTIFKDKTLVSTSKHITGHTLAAAGMCEAYIIKLMLEHNLPAPYQDYDISDFKEEFGDINLAYRPQMYPGSNIIMSNNFAFGGNNASLIFSI